MGELLNINHLNFSYHNPERETPVLFDVSFHVDEGEIVAVVGAQGCGKSTLLSLISGLLTPDSGALSLNGKDIKNSGKSIGYMPQKTSNEKINGMLPIVTEDSYLQINEYANTYGMITFISAYPSELSACTRQRIALIRSLMMEPDILLLDEPFRNLSEKTRKEISDDLWEILRKEKKTVIFATSDLQDAARLADRIITL